jgi:hypothetical protein
MAHNSSFQGWANLSDANNAELPPKKAKWEQMSRLQSNTAKDLSMALRRIIQKMGYVRPVIRRLAEGR